MSTSNVSVVVRQDLLGCFYQLLSYPDLTPKPSYWVAFLWKYLVGRDVFASSETSPLPVPIWLHASVHCGRRAGASRVAVLINFHNTESAAITFTAEGAEGAFQATASKMAAEKGLQGGSSGNDQTSRVNATAFVLRGKVYSDKVTLNGAPLELNKNGSLPMPAGKAVVHGAPLLVPPQSIAWLELGEVPGVESHCD
eukprot:gene658-1064_t